MHIQLRAGEIAGRGDFLRAATVIGDVWGLSMMGLTHMALWWGFLVALFLAVVRWLNGAMSDGSASDNGYAKAILEDRNP